MKKKEKKRKSTIEKRREKGAAHTGGSPLMLGPGWRPERASNGPHLTTLMVIAQALTLPA